VLGESEPSATATPIDEVAEPVAAEGSLAPAVPPKAPPEAAGMDLALAALASREAAAAEALAAHATPAEPEAASVGQSLLTEDLAGLLETLEVQRSDAQPGPEHEVAAPAVPLEAGAGPADEIPLEGEPDGTGPDVERTGDFATDLLALGLGELPPEFETAETGESDETPIELGEDAFVIGASVLEGADAETSATDVPIGDISELSDLLSSLSSLDETDEPSEAGSGGSDDVPPALAIDDEAPSAGVISTDAFLADFDSGNPSFSSGLGDELTALTGGGTARTRPAATASKVPDTGADSPMLHRDSHVDRDLVMRIIDGVKRL
jgi:hypothetical protein